MAKFPIKEARQELGFTPSTAVRADIDVRTGEGAVGAAVGQAGLAIAGQIRESSARKEAIRVRNRKNLDFLSSSLADELRKQRDSDITIMQGQTPPEKWEEESRKITTAFNNQITGLDFSPEASAKQQIISTSDLELVPEESFIASSRVISAATIKTAEESLTDAYRLGREDIAQRKLDFAETMRDNGVSAKEILLKFAAAEEAGEALRKQDTLDRWRQMIAERPFEVAGILSKELDARKQDEGTIPETELTSKDIQSLLNTATNRKTQVIADAEKQLNAQNKELETQLHNDIVAGEASITDIGSSGLPAAAQRRLEQDLSDTDKRNVSKTWALQDTPEATKEKDALLASIEAGLIDINQARSALSELARRKEDDRSIISKGTFDKTMEQFKKGGRDAIDVFTAEQTAKVGNALTVRLTQRQASLSVRGEARTLTPIERRQLSTTGFLLQVANHQLILYEEGLAQRLRTLGIEDTSGKEAKAEAVVIWEGIKRKPLERKINDFMTFSGQKLVRPVGVTKELWESSDARARAAIVNGVSKGMSNKEISELLFR